MIPSGLVSHILHKVRSALLARQASLCWSEHQTITTAQTLVIKLLDDSTLSKDNKSVMETGIKLSRALSALDIPNDPSLFLSRSVVSILDSYDQYLAINHTVFDNITNHHTNITTEDWNNVANNDTTLAVYSEAANAMGTKQWVVECNKWFETFSISFFRQGGARKHYMKTKLQEHQAEVHNTKASLGDSLVKDLMLTASTSTPVLNDTSNTNNYERIKLLDVGSCYNPIAKSPQAHLFEVTALDLYPVDSSVMQCDFLQLRLGPKGSQPVVISQPEPLPVQQDDDNQESSSRRSELELPEQVVKRQRRESEDPPTTTATTATNQAVPISLRLLQLPQQQYDVVTMCLVLNYLPTPALRLRMVQQARALLRSPSEQDSTVTDNVHSAHPHRTGLLLIAEKQSIFKPPFKQNSTATAKHSKKNAAKISKPDIETTKPSQEENRLDLMSDSLTTSTTNTTGTSSSTTTNTTATTGFDTTSTIASTSSFDEFDYWSSWVSAVCSCGFELVRYQYFPSSDGRKSHLFAFATVDLPASTTTTADFATGTGSTTTTTAASSTTGASTTTAASTTTVGTKIDTSIAQMWIKQDHEGQR